MKAKAFHRVAWQQMEQKPPKWLRLYAATSSTPQESEGECNREVVLQLSLKGTQLVHEHMADSIMGCTD